MKDKRAITEEQFAERSKPALRLFLSVDLENSTKLKQGRRSEGESWLSVVLDFATSFPQLFKARLQEHARLQGLPEPQMPPIWKMLGDELLFVQALEKADEARVLLDAFRPALAHWNKEVAEGTSRGRLFVKGAAWLAGFPIANAVIDAGDGREDYVGPSIDAGFRIARLATRRRLPVSVDLAWLLLHLRPATSLPLHFDGPALLKGVAEETGYPSLWLEVGDSDYVKAERQMLGYDGQSNSEEMERLCGLFIREFGVPAHIPFLASDADFVEKPPGYEHDLRQHVEWLRREVYLVDEIETEEPVSVSSELTPNLLLEELEGAQQK